jgi:hypothetical protein
MLFSYKPLVLNKKKTLLFHKKINDNLFVVSF